ncbi:MAG: hypothetical protein ABI658_29155 [Acidimicrobiales bacterium]
MKVKLEFEVEHQGQLDQLVSELRPLLHPAPTEDELAEIAAAQDDHRCERDARVLAFRLEHPEVPRGRLRNASTST